MTGPYRAGYHKCPCGCGAAIGNSRLACQSGWFRLPVELRRQVNETRNRSSLDPERRAILEAVLAWYRDNPAPEVKP